MIYRISETAISKTDSIKLNIYNKEFKLSIKYHKYTGQDVLDSQYETASKFKNAKINASLDKVKKFIIRDSQNYDDSVDSIDHIFKYIRPKYLFIPRDKGVAAIMCDYKYDPEHGLAIVFKNGSCTNVGPQDIIL